MEAEISGFATDARARLANGSQVVQHLPALP